MKIGILTFHWATNYGAVLQAYALQQYLVEQGHDATIIDYRPARVILWQFAQRVRYARIREAFREVRIGEFRRTRLIVSQKTFHSNAGLRTNCCDYDVYICGSDQVWNESFVLHAEATPVYSYFLDFVPDDKARIAYATSFGADELTNDVSSGAQRELIKFLDVGVRENSGRAIVERMGLSARVVADPTILMTEDFYKGLLDQDCPSRSGAFHYILHDNQSLALAVREHIEKRVFGQQPVGPYRTTTIRVPEWLSRIRNSEILVTNSFHGVVFALIFHTPFIALPVAGSNMNDRLYTLLGHVGLVDRIVERYDPESIESLICDHVDWDSVDRALGSMRADARTFLIDALQTALARSSKP